MQCRQCYIENGTEENGYKKMQNLTGGSPVVFMRLVTSVSNQVDLVAAFKEKPTLGLGRDVFPFKMALPIATPP